jgi:hypothetical protein
MMAANGSLILPRVTPVPAEQCCAKFQPPTEAQQKSKLPLSSLNFTQ